MIAFERRADLIRNSFDQGDFVIFEAVTRLAPNQTEQAKGVTADAYRRDQSSAAAQRGIKH